MNPASTFDPFEPMPFVGYIDPATGRQDRYLSLAHFIYSERFAGVDEHYRRYLLQLEDTELFRLEVDGVGFTGTDKPGWEVMRPRLIYSGIFMQALSNRERFGQLLANIDQLAIANCSFSDEAANAMGQFIGDVRMPQDKLKVLFLGSCADTHYIESCLGVIFGKREPQCLLALEDDGCSVGVSTFARNCAAPFSLLSSSQSDEALVESIQRRCTHSFHFVGGEETALTQLLLDRLAEAGIEIKPIQPKP